MVTCYTTSTSTFVGMARLTLSPTGEWAAIHLTSSRRRSEVAFLAPMRKMSRKLRSPAGIESSIPRKPSVPISSGSPSTITSSVVSSMPTCAARSVTNVASQLAKAARNSRPGEGADPPPPIPVGMSVTIAVPSDVSTRHLSLSSIYGSDGRTWPPGLVRVFRIMVYYILDRLFDMRYRHLLLLLIGDVIVQVISDANGNLLELLFLTHPYSSSSY
ncbi:MAG: hypothetical protein MAG451_01476 [Anaerolineales bacterium]|nr:hypothetical protein [Anaerolineales bacterium]